MKTEHTFEWRQAGPEQAGRSNFQPAGGRPPISIYRWIGWLAVGGFAIGLTVMFFISGMFAFQLR